MAKRVQDVVAQLQAARGTISVFKHVSDVGEFEQLAVFAGKEPSEHAGPDGPYRRFEVTTDDGGIVVVCHRRAALQLVRS